MIYKPNSKLIVLLALCMCLLFSYVPNSYASRGILTVQPEIVQFFLNIVGLETDIVDLDREDGFNRALYTDNLGSDPILIGFPETFIGERVPLLLVVGGEEIVVRVSEDGGLEDMAGNEVVMPAGIAEVGECVMAVIFLFLESYAMFGIPDLISLFNVIFNVMTRLIGCVVQYSG